MDPLVPATRASRFHSGSARFVLFRESFTRYRSALQRQVSSCPFSWAQSFRSYGVAVERLRLELTSHVGLWDSRGVEGVSVCRAFAAAAAPPGSSLDNFPLLSSLLLCAFCQRLCRCVTVSVSEAEPCYGFLRSVRRFRLCVFTSLSFSPNTIGLQYCPGKMGPQRRKGARIASGSIGRSAASPLTATAALRFASC